MPQPNTSKQNAQQKIEQLMNRFEEQKSFYLDPGYNETQTRRDFIDPFLKALGWDIDNEQGYAESYREVIHEDRQKVGDSNRAPDYAFRLHGGKRLFFLEAKKPSILIKDNAEPAYQVRRYGWSARLPISVVTDFQEFAIYDCTKKPLITDKASTARLEYLTYHEYLNKFDLIWDTFSRDRVLQGGFDRFIKDDTLKKGSSPPDKEFLASLDSWRTQLAISICKSNKQLDEDEINFAVQHIIDRIIFLRIAEDRSIEPYGNLRDCIKEGNLYQNLHHLFMKADEKYNSGLFDFGKDRISGNLEIENKVLKAIINDLYYPSPYAFSVFPVEIIGTAYEQFLGKQIRIDKSHRAKIEEKPAVRKAGGVYYTPQYIVDYIVQNTVGKLIENKTPKEIELIKIVDPACGSGSFLLGAYDYLLKYHKDYYTKNGTVSKGSKKDTLTPEGNLTTNEKKRILINNIYGVDIDTNAVEVSKLSLLLKCMEGETQASITSQMLLFHDRVLPTLDNNIKAGNSLIDIDFYDNELDFGDERTIKPFNWQKAFPEVFAQGGFDAVIGNPPWVSLNGKFGNDIIHPSAQVYLIKKYIGNTYMPNLYEYFVHKGLQLINKRGLFSFIVPDRLGFNTQFKLLRKKILNNYRIDEIIYKTPFPGIVTDTLIFRFSSKDRKNVNYKIAVGEYKKTLQTKSVQEYLTDPEHIFSYENNRQIAQILAKLFSNRKCEALDKIIETTSGFGGKSTEITQERKDQNQIKIVKGRSIHKYSPLKHFFFEFKKENITGRTTDKTKLGTEEKVLLRKTGYPIPATYDNSGTYPEQSLYFMFNNQTDNSLKYLTSLINSPLFQFVYINKLVTNKNSTPQLKKIDLDKFPVYKFDLNNKEEKLLHDEIVKMVDVVLDLNVESEISGLEEKKEQLKQKAEHFERKINQLIYQLYALKEDEIQIIEQSLITEKTKHL